MLFKWGKIKVGFRIFYYYLLFIFCNEVEENLVIFLDIKLMFFIFVLIGKGVDFFDVFLLDDKSSFYFYIMELISFFSKKFLNVYDSFF